MKINVFGGAPWSQNRGMPAFNDPAVSISYYMIPVGNECNSKMPKALSVNRGVETFPDPGG